VGAKLTRYMQVFLPAVVLMPDAACNRRPARTGQGCSSRRRLSCAHGALCRLRMQLLAIEGLSNSARTTVVILVAVMQVSTRHAMIRLGNAADPSMSAC